MEVAVLKNVRKTYMLGKVEIEALRGVDFVVKKGDIICLMGPSGSGKTTLLNILGTLDKPTSGDVYLFGENVFSLSHSKLAEFRNKNIGFIFQTFNLIPVLTVYENVEYPLILQNIPLKERKERVLRLLKEVGLEGQENKRPEELSGGQRQRVAIARALVTNPKLVIADEPTANLDHSTGKVIMELLKKLNQEFNVSIVFSTHDPLIASYAQKIVKIQDGLIVEEVQNV